jgi:hypothetical protein
MPMRFSENTDMVCTTLPDIGVGTDVECRICCSILLIGRLFEGRCQCYSESAQRSSARNSSHQGLRGRKRTDTKEPSPRQSFTFGSPGRKSWAFWMLHRRDMAVRALIVGRPVLLIETTNLSLSRLFIHYSKRLNPPICKQSYFSQMIQRLLFYTLNYDRRRYRLSEVPRKSRPKLNGLSCFIMLVYMTEWAVIYWRWTLVCSLEL